MQSEHASKHQARDNTHSSGMGVCNTYLITGSTRASSSSTLMRCELGRVLWPPTSITAAPARDIRRAASTAPATSTLGLSVTLAGAAGPEEGPPAAGCPVDTATGCAAGACMAAGPAVLLVLLLLLVPLLPGAAAAAAAAAGLLLAGATAAPAGCCGGSAVGCSASRIVPVAVAAATGVCCLTAASACCHGGCFCPCCCCCCLLPAAAACCCCCAGKPVKRPPSLKLSGVMFRMPQMCVLRPSSQICRWIGRTRLRPSLPTWQQQIVCGCYES